MTGTPAIRVQRVGRYFGPPLEMDGAERPRQAWRSLLRIAGIELAPSGDGPQATVSGPGHVLEDVTLDIERGSTVCLMGPSGSGKSVLLKILAGVIPPTAGRVETYGSVTSLVTASGGLDASKTAMDNIRASNAFKNAPPDAAERFGAEVIAFAELEGFERVPMRTFSTGMTMRMGVALALGGRPEIVLVDDVLRVGDIGFQQKCVARIHALKESGSTLVLTSSDEAFVEQIATRVITLDAGRIVHDSAEADSLLAAGAEANAELEWQVTRALPEDDFVAFLVIDGEVVQEDEEIYFDVRMEVAGKADGLKCRPIVSVLNETVVLFRSPCPEFLPLSRDPLGCAVRVPTRLLPDGRYRIDVAAATVRDGRAFAIKSNNALTLTVRREHAPVADGEIAPLLQPSLDWEVERLADVSAAVTAP